MILVIHDTRETLRIGHVPVDVAIDLIGQLPNHIGVHISPDELAEVQPVDPSIKPSGYFGLAVALARKTWEG